MLPPFYIWQGRTLKGVNPLDVVALSAERVYTKIHLTQDRHLIARLPLTTLLKQVSGDIFVRTHRGWAVSVYYLEEISKDKAVIGSMVIPVTKPYFDNLVTKLNILS
ncbi:LytTR family DNA-binding domain-containing protein [Flavihumibacter petaseus]|uniref:Putative LytTR family DNA-binding protein n=1 Tax=Flavihumibacter petaseus NBRC 106054 TaxID=1220578 RepID=A0A0E9MYZ3_9BACT|nr:LytTR family DNA-binding domain-containing protein [Flavihumibacter petaseus]GAO42330.1 putative LytTR family DNA-binding protein [Flavihumibacter petaseus NBRC 106054]